MKVLELFMDWRHWVGWVLTTVGVVGYVHFIHLSGLFEKIHPGITIFGGLLLVIVLIDIFKHKVELQ